MTPFLSVGERYDDNIFQDSSNEVDDFITVVSPGIHLHYVPTRDTELNFEYNADFEFFAQNTEQNQVSQRAVLRFVSPLTRTLSVNVRDTFVITEEPRDRVLEIADPVIGLRPVSEQSRRRTLSNRARGSLDVQLTQRTTLELLFESLIDDVDVPEEVDEFRYTVGADLGYLIARRSRVSVSYDVAFHTFAENAPLAPGAKPADFEVHTARAGFQHDFSPTLSGNIAFGYAVVTSDDPALDGDAGIVANVGITKILRTGRASFSYRRGFTSGGGGGGTVLADTFTASFSASITPKVTAGLSSNLSFYNFQQATGDDRLFWVIRPSLAYQMFRFWSLSVAYDYALTNFDPANAADRYDQRLIFLSQFALRERLFLNLTYSYTSRRLDEVTPRDRLREFDRNEVILTLTFAPTFFF